MATAQHAPAAAVAPAAAGAGRRMTFPEAADWVAREYGIPKPHYATLHRWRVRGVGGHLLPTVKLVGTRYVTEQALRDFFAVTNDVEADGQSAA